jgi:cystathionine beta-synthase
MTHERNILSLIGNTPVVRAERLDVGPCELFFKLESQNPGGSIKDRIARRMIAAAEAEGKLAPGGLLVEATAGNTGLGLALVSRLKGYKLLLVIPDKMSQEKIFHLKALGVEIVMTRSDVGRGHPEYYQDMAERIAQERGGFYVNQFENPHNPETHAQETGPEILAQMEGRLDAVVCGVGSGGTLTGLGRFFAQAAPQVEMVLADPEGSILAPYINKGVMVTPGHWLVEGIGEDFIPKNCELQWVKRAYSVSDAESIATARLLLVQEGIMCGSSSGTLAAAALRYCRTQKEPKRVVSLICDSGNKYLSKIFNDFWLDDHGFIERAQMHDLRDLITRPHTGKNAVTVRPEETLQAAYRKMKMYDVSQLPVMDDETLVGILSETDILLAIMGNPNGFSIPAAKAMTRSLVTIEADEPVERLLPLFERSMVAIVMHEGAFQGLITPIDLLQYLRKRVGHG